MLCGVTAATVLSLAAIPGLAYGQALELVALCQHHDMQIQAENEAHFGEERDQVEKLIPIWGDKLAALELTVRKFKRRGIAHYGDPTALSRSQLRPSLVMLELLDHADAALNAKKNEVKRLGQERRFPKNLSRLDFARLYCNELDANVGTVSLINARANAERWVLAYQAFEKYLDYRLLIASGISSAFYAAELARDKSALSEEYHSANRLEAKLAEEIDVLLRCCH